jgi:hypothetical protein
LALVSGVSTRAVAKKYDVSRDAAWRHLTNHVPPERRAQLVAGPMKLGELAEKATAENSSLIDYVNVVRSTLVARFLAVSEAGDNQNTGLLAGRLTEVLRLQAGLTGELSKATSSITNNVAIINSPFMADVQSMLLRTLAAFPEARTAVVRGLEELAQRTMPDASPVLGRLIEQAPRV